MRVCRGHSAVFSTCAQKQVPVEQKPQLKHNDMDSLISCKRILESTDIDNEQKLNKLVSDDLLTDTIRSILAEGEVVATKKNVTETSVLCLTVETISTDKTNFELVKEDIYEVHSILYRYSASTENYRTCR